MGVGNAVGGIVSKSSYGQCPLFWKPIRGGSTVHSNVKIGWADTITTITTTDAGMSISRYSPGWREAAGD